MRDSKKDRRDPKKPAAETEGDRRAPAGRRGSWRWLRGLLHRPLGFVKLNGKRHITLVERRRPAEVVGADERKALCDELGLRLLEHGEAQAHVMRALAKVHEALRLGGWHDVGLLPSALLGKALEQARMLTDRERTPRLSVLLEQLRRLQVAAQVREDRAAEIAKAEREAALAAKAAAAAAAAAASAAADAVLPPAAPGADSRLPAVELDEASIEEFEEAESSWIVPLDVEPEDKPTS